MPMYKSAQTMLEVNDVKELGGENEIVLYEEKPDMEDVVELHQEPKEVEMVFKLAPLPGCDKDIPIEVSTDDDLEVEEKTKKDKNDLQGEMDVLDVWDTKSVKPENAIEWAKSRLSTIPTHSGKEVLGLERVQSYLKRVDNEMSKMIANDYSGKIDIGMFEALRREIYDALPRLEKAKEGLMKQYKHSAEDRAGIVKEAKQTSIHGIIITVPLLISRCARVIINGMVSGGHDVEDLFDRQVKEFSLDKREQSELMQLLEDMGYAQPRRDRGYPRDHKMDYTSSNNMDFGANYTA